jgi:hypothetical protein
MGCAIRDRASHARTKSFFEGRLRGSLLVGDLLGGSPTLALTIERGNEDAMIEGLDNDPQHRRHRGFLTTERL